MRLRMKNFNFMGVHWKIQFLVDDGVHEKNVYILSPKSFGNSWGNSYTTFIILEIKSWIA